MIFKATLMLNQLQLVELTKQGWLQNATTTSIELISDEVDYMAAQEKPAKAAAPVAKKPRAPRGSKVEAIINKELEGGAFKTTKELRKALQDGGLNPNSFGATASKMKKAGEIHQGADGAWSLVLQGDGLRDAAE